ERESTDLPRKAFLLAAMIDLTPARRMTRESVAAYLFEDTRGDAAGGLRQLLLRTRRWEAAHGARLLQADRTSLWRDESTLRSDLEGFLRISSVSSAPELERLTALYSGDLLTGIDDPGGELGQWLFEKRTE